MYKIIGADGKEYGPISADQVRQWVAEGRANAATLAASEGATDWKPLGSFPEFSLLFAASTAPATLYVPGSAVRKTHPLAVSGLVLGIISITVGWCCCGLGLPISLVGLVLSVIALLEISKHPEAYSGKGLAIAGLVICLLHLLATAAIYLAAGTADHWQRPPRVHRL
jgi:hypothetical protein